MESKTNVSSVSSVSLGLGNTKPNPKKISPSLYWCFTSYKTEINEYNELIEDLKCADCVGFILGREICPTTGKKHIQGYLEFKSRKRPKLLFRDDTIHWEKRRGNRKQNLDYCCKDGDFFVEGFKIKKPVKILSDDMLYNWQKNILDIIKQEPDDRKIYWYYGKSGNNGKTSFCKYLAVLYGAIILGGKSADMKNGVIQYKINNDDCEPEIIVINLPRSFNSDYLSYTGIEEVKDMCFYSGKYEGGMVVGNSPHLIIFSNELPDMEKVSHDRWEIYDIEKDHWLLYEEYDDEFIKAELKQEEVYADGL